MKVKQKTGFLLLGIVMLVVAIMWLVPIFYATMNSFKTFAEVTIEPLAFPESLYFGNYLEIWESTDYPTLFRNSLISLVFSELGIVLFGSMSGYWLSRLNNRFAKCLRMYYSLGVMVPFQAIMICLVRVMSSLNLVNTLPGLILVNIALGLPTAIFLYTAGAKAISKNIDEAAEIDGASSLRLFFKVIFPCLSPVTGSVMILSSLVVWNDYIRALILLTERAMMTIPVGTSLVIFGQYANKDNLAVTALIMAALPMIILFLFLQRYIVSGITAGSVKE